MVNQDTDTNTDTDAVVVKESVGAQKHMEVINKNSPATKQYMGVLQKLSFRLGEPLEYFLSIGNEKVLLNSYLGTSITLSYQGKVHCLHCGRVSSKSYSQGYCFPCSQTLARCDLCIVRPEKCHYHLGSCREPEWGLSQCFIPHVVYIANTSGLKVGITRETQIPTRWVDQGAVQALPLLKVENRYHSGLIEMGLKNTMNDKTDWRKMLKGEIEPIDLFAKREEILKELKMMDISFYARLHSNIHSNVHLDRDASINPKDIPIEIIQNPELLNIEYPVLEYPKKISSCNFEKTPEVTGRLLGIKGQYLILDVGVINIRNLAGSLFSVY